MTSAYPILDEGSVVAYVAERGLAGLVAGGDGEMSAREVSDGNLNSVFIVRRRDSEPGVAVKQALPWVRVAGASWPLTPRRAEAEARAYERLAVLAPDLIPAYHGYDPDTFTLVMEDLGGLQVLRTVTVAGEDPGEVGAAVGAFVGRLAFATSDFGMDAEERKRLIAASINPELCRMTEEVVLTEPYIEHEHNHHLSSVDALVADIREDAVLLEEVSALKQTFMSKCEALIHGDLHSGSIMVGGGRVAMIDPEFSFVGPVGFDLGLFWANAIIAAVRSDVLGSTDQSALHLDQVATSWYAFTEAVRAAWPTRVDTSFGDAYRERWLTTVWVDGLGFAGVEAIRRLVGYSHAADIETLPAPLREQATVRLLQVSRALIVDRASLTSPADIIALATTHLKERRP